MLQKLSFSFVGLCTFSTSKGFVGRVDVLYVVVQSCIAWEDLGTNMTHKAFSSFVTVTVRFVNRVGGELLATLLTCFL